MTLVLPQNTPCVQDLIYHTHPEADKRGVLTRTSRLLSRATRNPKGPSIELYLEADYGGVSKLFRSFRTSKAPRRLRDLSTTSFDNVSETASCIRADDVQSGSAAAGTCSQRRLKLQPYEASYRVRIRYRYMCSLAPDLEPFMIMPTSCRPSADKCCPSRQGLWEQGCDFAPHHFERR